MGLEGGPAPERGQAAGINLVHVPYKGLGPAYSDVLGGQVPMMFAGVSNVVPYMKTGRLRVLAIENLPWHEGQKRPALAAGSIALVVAALYLLIVAV